MNFMEFILFFGSFINLNNYETRENPVFAQAELLALETFSFNTFLKGKYF